jgi:hypothetical protein
VEPSRPLPNRDQLSVLTATIVLAFALTRFLDLPPRPLTATVFGSEIGLALNGPVLMLLLVAALISAGSDHVIRSHPALRHSPERRTVMHWIVPGATTLVLGAALNRAPEGPLWWLGLGLSAVLLIIVLAAEYVVVDRDDPRWPAAALVLTALAYALALLLFALLRGLSARALITAPLGGLVAAALALRLLVLRAAPLARAGLFALVIGAVSGEALWALNYWRVAPSSAGLLAMIPFYLGVGVAQQHLAGRLTARVWVEYGVVGALGLAIALAYAFAESG